jgi:hypothetical protein
MNQSTTSQNPTTEITSYWTKIAVPLQYIVHEENNINPSSSSKAMLAIEKKVGNVDINNNK